MSPKLKPLDMSKADDHEHPDIKIGSDTTYLCLIRGNFFVGYFSRQWYGLVFNYSGGFFQFDAPGFNSSEFQQIWQIANADEIAQKYEMEYARSRREWCIRHGCTSNGKKIDETSPIEAWLYKPQKPAMPEDADDF
jgi:hypothetical protein